MLVGYQSLDIGNMIFDTTTIDKASGIPCGKRFVEIIERADNKAVLVQNFKYNSPDDGIINFGDVFAVATPEITFSTAAIPAIRVNRDKFVINMFRTPYTAPSSTGKFYTINIICEKNDGGNWVAYLEVKAVG